MTAAMHTLHFVQEANLAYPVCWNAEGAVCIRGDIVHKHLHKQHRSWYRQAYPHWHTDSRLILDG